MDYASLKESHGPTLIYIMFRAAKGRVAESIIQIITLALRERGDRRRPWVRVVEEHLPNHSPKAGCGVMIEDFF